MKSECKKFRENSGQMAPVSTICDEYCSLGALRDTSVHEMFTTRPNVFTVFMILCSIV